MVADRHTITMVSNSAMRPTTVAAVLMRTIESRVRKEFGRKVRPYKLLLELSDNCNSRCKSCAIWKTSAQIKAKQMTLDHIEKLFASSGRDLIWLALSGGEVTLYDGFPQVVELAKKYCPRLRLVTFTTNGLLPKAALAWARLVRSAGFDGFITISLDGDADTHDAIRGVKGNHQLAWETYELLRADGIVVHFGITVSRRNEEFVANRYVEFRDKIKAVTFLHGDGIYGQPNLTDDDSIFRSIHTIHKLYKTDNLGDVLEKMYIRLGLAFLKTHRLKNTIPCSVGHTSLHVRPNGNTLLCMYMPPIGNVKAGASLAEMVNSPQSKRLLAQIAADHCPHCWMNCYAPHSVLMSPLKSAFQYLTSRVKLVPARFTATNDRVTEQYVADSLVRSESLSGRHARRRKTRTEESKSSSFHLPLIQEAPVTPVPTSYADTSTAENFSVARPPSPDTRAVLREPERSVLEAREHRKHSKTQPEARIGRRLASKHFGSSGRTKFKLQ